ncbi:hypothetical protein [Fictibacillus sp. JL2B1089]|uniref:hypothetical protein n=1 Tax=Fictibacillus sp. JL2B1089 TaxID=3399565 RepID=UPI003A84C121
MYKYRITKYNPVFRDNEGIYLENDWTGISDLGKSFNGKELTMEQYKETEENYISAIQLIMSYMKTPYLKIEDAIQSFSKDMFFDLIADYKPLYTKDIIDFYLDIKNINEVRQDNCKLLLSLMLREDIGAKVFYPRKLKVFIGYDYLMSVHTSRPLEPIFHEIEQYNLYVEDFSN